ncbi:helix-turn-helix domain-containing protein [Halomonas sp. ATCH28]|uniref:Helix-turn-helix domain-containing protein n=1 Tax=Halomonas gemina TaxID=2945105 RepID=A0ABT0T1A7_9GAMM|nr:helix-turn-helix domain-containing protein [Halomonas gemina]MCL7940696.1 helix-turn-helix domain-containing protein [Halomonas gemina]
MNTKKENLGPEEEGRDQSKVKRTETRGSARYKINPTSQKGRVLLALSERAKSSAELQWELRIAHAPSVIRDLRKAGIHIVSESHPWPSRPGKTISRYRLMAGGG